MTFPNWVGNVLLVVLSIYIVWNVAKLAMQWSQFKPMDVVWGVVILFVTFIAFTNRQSPINAVRVVDTGYENVYGELGESRMMADVIKAFGQKPESFGLTGPNAQGEPQVLVPTQAAGAAQQPGVVVAPPNPVVPAVVWDFLPVPAMVGDNTILVTADGAGVGRTLNAGSHNVCGWSPLGASNGHAQYLKMCDDGQLLYFVYVQNKTSIPPAPQVANAPVNQTTAPEYTTAETNAAKANCWTTWASVYLTGTTNDSWGTMAIPAGTGPWELSARGDWNNNFRGKANELWYLSNKTLGIEDFVVNGYVGRSFLGNNDSGTIVVYGANSNIWQECLAIVGP